MLVIVGLFVWLVAGIVAIAGELSNAGAAHPLIENLRVRLSPHGVDRHVVPLWDPGRRGGAAGTEGVFFRPAAHRGARARRAAARFQREMAFLNRARDTRLEHQQRADSAAVALARPDEGATRRRRNPLPGRWSRDR
jgi:hypothetical protein